MPAYLIEVQEAIPAGRVIVRGANPRQCLLHFWRGKATVESLSGDELLKLILDDKVPVEDSKAVAEDLVPVVQPPLPLDETYAHKLACPAGSGVPIGKANCRCMELD